MRCLLQSKHWLGSPEQAVSQCWIARPGPKFSLIPLAARAGVMVGGCILDAAGDGKGALCQLSVIGGGGLDAHRAGSAGRRATTGLAALGACTGSICGDQSIKARTRALLAET